MPLQAAPGFPREPSCDSCLKGLCEALHLTRRNRMVAAQKEARSDKGQNNRRKTNDRKPRRPAAPPPYREPLVDKDGVNDPGDHGQYLYRVPVPGRMPDNGRIGKPDYKSSRHERKSRHHAVMSDGVEPIKRGHPLVEKPEILFLYMPFLEQVHYADAEGQSEQR